MPEPAVLALVVITFVIIASLIARQSAKRRRKDAEARAVVEKVLRTALNKGDSVKTVNHGSAKAKYRECRGVIIDPPYFKDDGTIVVAIRSDRDSQRYIKRILVRNDKGQWLPTQTSISKSR